MLDIYLFLVFDTFFIKTLNRQKKLQEQLSENISDTLDEDTVTRFKYEIQACYDEFRDVLENL